MAFVIPSNTEHLKCPYDPAGDYMRTSPAPIYPDRLPEQQAYFERPIPKLVHQIWFGEPARMDSRNTKMWQSYAQLYGYSYRLWTEGDIQELKRIMPPRNYDLFAHFLKVGDYYGASDVARLSILLTQGGTYADIDIRPPTHNAKIIDLATLLPMKGIVFMTEKVSRNVIESSLFVANNFILSAVEHPLLQHLVDTIVDNFNALNQGAAGADERRSPVHPMYLSGPFFVSRSLAGIFTILPFNYASAYNMREYEPGAN